MGEIEEINVNGTTRTGRQRKLKQIRRRCKQQAGKTWEKNHGKTSTQRMIETTKTYVGEGGEDWNTTHGEKVGKRGRKGKRNNMNQTNQTDQSDQRKETN